MSFRLLNKKLAGVAFAALLGTFVVGAGVTTTVSANATNFSTSAQGSTVEKAAPNTKVAGKKKRKKRRKKRRRRGSYYSS